jgi:hypothetical protein
MANSAQFIYSPALSDYAVQNGVGTFGTASAIAPVFRVNALVGQYLKRDRQLMGASRVKRAPGELVKRVETAKGAMQTFQAVDHSIIKSVPWEIVQGYGAGDLFGEQQNAAKEAINEIMHAHEIAVEALLWNGGTQANLNTIYGASQVTTPTTKWDASASRPDNDIKVKKMEVYKRSGEMPNTLLINRDTFNAIATSTSNSIGERVKYTAGTIPDQTLLAQLFGVERVVIADELYNTANPGQTDSFGLLYGVDSALLLYVDPRPTRDSNTIATTFAGVTPEFPFMGVLTRNNEDNKSFEVQVSAAFDAKLVNASCGAAFYNVLT